MKEHESNEKYIEIPVSSLEEMQEKLAKLEEELTEYSIRLHEEDIKTMSDEEYEEKFAVYEEIQAMLQKSPEVEGFLDKVSVWIWVYAIFMLILTFPTLLYYTFSVGVLNLLMEPLILAGFPDVVVAIFAVYTVPLLLTLLSWFLKLNIIKTAENKKAFNIVWIIQSIMILGGGIWAFFSVILYFV